MTSGSRRRESRDDYDADQAALDAICFQTTDTKGRHKILSERLTLQEAIDYGRTSVHTRIKNKKMEDIANGKGIEEGVSRVGSSNTKGDAKDNACKKCGFESPMSGKCPASRKDCYRLVQQNSLNIVQIEIKLQKLVQASKMW